MHYIREFISFSFGVLLPLWSVISLRAKVSPIVVMLLTCFHIHVPMQTRLYEAINSDLPLSHGWFDGLVD